MRPADWPEKMIFLPNQRRGPAEELRRVLHDVVFFFDWGVPSEDSRGEFQKKMQRSRGNRKP